MKGSCSPRTIEVQATLSLIALALQPVITSGNYTLLLTLYRGCRLSPNWLLTLVQYLMPAFG